MGDMQMTNFDFFPRDLSLNKIRELSVAIFVNLGELSRMKVIKNKAYNHSINFRKKCKGTNVIIITKFSGIFEQQEQCDFFD